MEIIFVCLNNLFLLEQGTIRGWVASISYLTCDIINLLLNSALCPKSFVTES